MQVTVHVLNEPPLQSTPDQTSPLMKAQRSNSPGRPLILESRTPTPSRGTSVMARARMEHSRPPHISRRRKFHGNANCHRQRWRHRNLHNGCEGPEQASGRPDFSVNIGRRPLPIRKQLDHLSQVKRVRPVGLPSWVHARRDDIPKQQSGVHARHQHCALEYVGQF